MTHEGTIKRMQERIAELEQTRDNLIERLYAKEVKNALLEKQVIELEDRLADQEEGERHLGQYTHDWQTKVIAAIDQLADTVHTHHNDTPVDVLKATIALGFVVHRKPGGGEPP